MPVSFDRPSLCLIDINKRKERIMRRASQ